MPKQSQPLPQLVTVQIVPLKLMHPHSTFTIAQLLMSLFPTCSKSRNTPTRARSGFYQKGCCLFQLGVASRCADVFEELGLELQTVSSSSHLLIFFSEFVEVCECIIYDASLCLVTKNANGLLEAEAYPLRSS